MLARTKLARTSLPRIMMHAGLLRDSLSRSLSRHISTPSREGESTAADLFNNEMAATFGTPPSTYDGNDDGGSSAVSLSRSRVQVTDAASKVSESSGSSSESQRDARGEIHVHIHLPVGYTKAASPNVIVHVHLLHQE
jgi:hypothetical protein